jgi:hypothetical protein
MDMNAISTTIVPPYLIQQLQNGEATKLAQRITEAKVRPEREDSVITGEEAHQIVGQAMDGMGVSRGEHLLLEDLYLGGLKASEVYTEAIPELSDDQYYLTQEAVSCFQQFLTYHPLPTDGALDTRVVPESAADLTALLS